MKTTTFGIVLALIAVSAGAQTSGRLGRACRVDRAGWVYVHLEGAPRDIGYQHGYLLAPEIDDALRMAKSFLKGSSGKRWAFYRAAAARMFWPKLDAEYRAEIDGIVEGLRARGMRYDRTDIVAWNGWIDIAWYYIPYLEEKKGKVQHTAKESCSAFIATGRATQNGQIVMAHNCWVDYVVGERWRVIADIVPSRGHRILMDCLPGFIHSGDDFAENDAGILITETTIAGFKGFRESGAPEFLRARKAAQYATSIDDFVRIMVTDSNGGYANDWLVGDIKRNEIARLELGLKNHRVWRTTDGIYYGSNFPSDPKLMVQEATDYKPNDFYSSPNARKLRWERLGAIENGKLTAEVAKRLLADHFDQANLVASPSCRTLCGHIDDDPKGVPEAGWGAYYPAGAVQAKVTTAALARKMRMWAHMGHPCGSDFLVAPFLTRHPAYRWQAGYLHDMKAYPWTLVGAKR